MGILKNIKHEKFCQSLIKHDGCNSKAVMEESGFSHSPAYFSHLKNRPEIKARVLELRKEASKDNENVLSLQERLEMLSNIAADPSNLATVRIRALAELHKQCGDDITRVDMDLNSETNSVIQFVEVQLPKRNKEEIEPKITGIELDSLDAFLNGLNEVAKDNDAPDTDCPF